MDKKLAEEIKEEMMELAIRLDAMLANVDRRLEQLEEINREL